MRRPLQSFVVPAAALACGIGVALCGADDDGQLPLPPTSGARVPASSTPAPGVDVLPMILTTLPAGASVPPATKPFVPKAPPGVPLPIAALNGDWQGGSHGLHLIAGAGNVTVTGHYGWQGTYDEKTGTLVLHRHPTAEELDPKAPDWARAFAAGKITWYLVLTVKREAGTFGAYTLEGLWYKGAVDWNPKDFKNPDFADDPPIPWYTEGEPSTKVSYKKVRSL